MTAGVAEGKLVQSMLEELGEPVKLQILTDSIAAIGITKRLGPGRVRHLEVKDLWIQDELRKGKLTVRHLPGESNPADLLTKFVPKPRLQKLASLIGMRTEDSDYLAALPRSQAENTVSMVEDDFEIIQPQCRHCGTELVCPICGPAVTSSSSSTQAVDRPRPRQRAAALRGEQTPGYGVSGRAGDAQLGHRDAASFPTVQQLQRLRSLLRRREDAIIQGITTHGDAEAVINRLLMELRM